MTNDYTSPEILLETRAVKSIPLLDLASLYIHVKIEIYQKAIKKPFNETPKDLESYRRYLKNMMEMQSHFPTVKKEILEKNFYHATIVDSFEEILHQASTPVALDYRKLEKKIWNKKD